MKEKLKTMDDLSRKLKELERTNGLLEKTIKSKNPNSLPMMIKAAKETHTPDGIDPEQY